MAYVRGMGYPRPLFEVADVIRLHGDTFLASHSVSWHQRQVLFRMQACRTAQLGGHIDVCPTCAGTQRISYNSCRDRHCPKCQGREREKWVERSLARILPVPHFHVVFTLPDTLRPLFLAQPRRLYTLLFQSASRALLELTADPRHLGALPGFIAILHTWAQNLSHHPHLHCIVTAGGLAPDDSRWIETRPTFLLPVNALAKRFRCLFRHALIRLLASHHLGLWDSPSLASFHQALRQKRWVVYAKRPFRGPEPLFRYLDYGVFLSGKMIAMICDDKLFFKPTEQGRKFFQSITEGIPYPGAKPCFLVPEEEWDNRDWLASVAKATFNALPAPKKKPKKGQ